MNKVINTKVEFRDIGLIDYNEAWDYQTQLFDEIIALKLENRPKADTDQQPTSNYFIFCEHPHVYTLGKSGKESNLLLDLEGLERAGATYIKTNRGGDITYHGPGQIVGYPILDLENFFTDIHRYLRSLEEVIIKTLSHYGIVAGRYPGYTGVWIDAEGENARKICAMGVKSSRWVTMHGLALNVNTNLSYFGNIVPCGIEDKTVTSIENELGHPVDIEEVKSFITTYFKKEFGVE